MIVINATITADAETITAMTDAIIKMEKASLEEDGCQEYSWAVAISDGSQMRITERWDNIEALIAHFSMPHMAEFQAAMAANPSKDTEIHCYEATEIPFPAM
tara:strand:- start:436 stop:741 length:306 start_codon:yes stop_codon:yes gene_type:complete